MKNFELVGIKSPGTVNLPNLGTIDLEKIDDKKAEQLWRQGLPFLKPTPAYRKKLFPDEKPLAPTPTPQPMKGDPPTRKPGEKK